MTGVGDGTGDDGVAQVPGEVLGDVGEELPELVRSAQREPVRGDRVVGEVLEETVEHSPITDDAFTERCRGRDDLLGQVAGRQCGAVPGRGRSPPAFRSVTVAPGNDEPVAGQGAQGGAGRTFPGEGLLGDHVERCTVTVGCCGDDEDELLEAGQRASGQADTHRRSPCCSGRDYRYDLGVEVTLGRVVMCVVEYRHAVRPCRNADRRNEVTTTPAITRPQHDHRAATALEGGCGTVGNMTRFSVAHFSDTHLGLSTYRARSAEGHNQRSVDMVDAFAQAVEAIRALDPALVIHSGDVGEKPHLANWVLGLLGEQLEALAEIRPDGTRRQVVIIAGNHDQPHDRTETCFLELYRRLPGVHVVTDGYRVVRFDGAGHSRDCDPVLHGVAVHAIPHSALANLDTEAVTPHTGMLNILTTHGVAGGAPQFRRLIGPEDAIDETMLQRDWDYVALGHYHAQGPVPIDPQRPEMIWYAGSTETCDFSDYRSAGAARGWLQIDLEHRDGQLTRRVTPRSLRTRLVRTLTPLDVGGLSPTEITAELITRVSDQALTGGVVAQVVEGIDRDTWSLLDLTAVRRSAAALIHLEIIPRFAVPTPATAGGAEQGPADTVAHDGLDALLARAATVIDDPAARERAVTIITAALTNLTPTTSNETKEVA
jgi:DNA repair exonuclease SbcCD nuclease subunit